MARLYTYINTYFETVEDLVPALQDLARDRTLTSSQLATLRDAISLLLPCQVKLGCRTPLSIMYCEAGGRLFRVGQRGQFIPGAWRADMKTKRFW